jgi:hypothetical protein
MNAKLLVIAFLVMAVAFSATVSIDTAHAKYCNPSGCKGTKGYYTENGHHHCFEGSKDCRASSYVKGS